ncbi:basic proline-rich protein-like [Ochotona princeps]|uniref:basic proline-rich protein-like n=1 Tax=Ochotona princeps TaxID=9978 RepID=UPI002714B5D1|nr:basic proline-rich protein-like [Ochotona princeps]
MEEAQQAKAEARPGSELRTAEGGENGKEGQGFQAETRRGTRGDVGEARRGRERRGRGERDLGAAGEGSSGARLGAGRTSPGSGTSPARATPFGPSNPPTPGTPPPRRVRGNTPPRGLLEPGCRAANTFPEPGPIHPSPSRPYCYLPPRPVPRVPRAFRAGSTPLLLAAALTGVPGQSRPSPPALPAPTSSGHEDGFSPACCPTALKIPVSRRPSAPDSRRPRAAASDSGPSRDFGRKLQLLGAEPALPISRRSAPRFGLPGPAFVAAGRGRSRWGRLWGPGGGRETGSRRLRASAASRPFQGCHPDPC